MISGSMLDAMNTKTSSIHVMSRDHRCYFVNDYWRQLHTLNKKTSVVEGLSYADIPHKAFYSCSEVFAAHDETVFCSRATLSSLEIHEYDSMGGWLTFLLRTQPIIHHDKVEGLIGEATLLPSYLAHYYQNLKHQITVCFDKHRDNKLLLRTPNFLCDSEFDTVYLLMLGLKPKQIANLRTTSINTVYTILNNLRFKLSLETNRQLVEYAMEQRWYNCIPPMFRYKETTLRIK